VFVKRWQLACEKTIAHVVVMPNVTKEKIYTFVNELVKCRTEAGVSRREGKETFWPVNGEEGTTTSPGTAAHRRFCAVDTPNWPRED
jgi:hypothetical protein